MCTAPRVEELDLTGIDIVAVDLETWDPELKTKGSGAVRGIGKVCGIGVCTGKQTTLKKYFTTQCMTFVGFELKPA